MRDLSWHMAAKLQDFKTQDTLSVIIADKAFLLVKWHGTIHAFNNNCPHENLPLTGAEIEGDVIICPHHGARFCIKNGEVMSPPAFEDLETFPVKIDNDIIYIGL